MDIGIRLTPSYTPESVQMPDLPLFFADEHGPNDMRVYLGRN